MHIDQFWPVVTLVFGRFYFMAINAFSCQTKHWYYTKTNVPDSTFSKSEIYAFASGYFVALYRFMSVE